MIRAAHIRRGDVLVSVVLTVVVLGPALLRGGYILRGDMVFVPGQPWKSAWLGLDGSVPRAVPMDAVVWALGLLVPGDVVQRLLLVATLVLLALGVARLLVALPAPARYAGMVLACWNPYVYERLAIGQWPFVLGCAVLVWLVDAAVRLRDRERAGGRKVAGWSVAAGVCAPSIGLVAGLVVACIVLTRPSRRALGLGALAVVGGNLPWLVPALLRPAIIAPQGQFPAFGARAESAAGVLPSVLSLGGIWKTSIVPPERGSSVVVAVAAVTALVSLVELWRARRRVRWARGLVLAAVSGLMIAWLPSIGPVQSALGSLAGHVPAVAVLRDSTRYEAPAVVAVAVGFAHLCARVASRCGRPAGTAAVAALAVLPVALLPSLALGLGGFLGTSTFRSTWFAAREVRTRAGEPGTTVVLPWRGAYRGFSWTDGHAVLDPAQRFFPGEVVIDDRTYVGNRVLGSEDPYLIRIRKSLESADPARDLAVLGVRWVLVERGPGIAPVGFAGGTTRYDAPDLQLIELADVQHSPRRSPAAGWVIAADFVSFAQFVVASCCRRPRWG
jgi:hypothetical protein